ncbi:ATP-binding protein, partial [Methylogaea oryzae]|uniref:ATP-binding protein n=1 Tax=Methylogaea oryzae TaxID=1295382 RepID=UPI0020D1EF90
MEEVFHLVEGAAADKGLTLSCHLAPDLPAHVVGDPTRLRQVLLNLVGNAIKFTAEGGVTVLVARAPDTAHGLLLFEVVDTGIGIAEEVQPRLFNLFTQADPSDTRKYGGSGLGLAIAKRLVELWNGSMGLESQPGGGSRFWFTFGAPADG